MVGLNGGQVLAERQEAADAVEKPFKGKGKAAKSSRWVRIDWDAAGGPYGDELRLLQRKEYGLGNKNGVWRILVPKESD